MKSMIPLLALLITGARAQTDKYSEIAGLPAVPSYAVSSTKDQPTIDGRLAEKAWAAAAPITLLFPWEEQLGDKQRTTIKLLRDQKYLYVGYECADSDITASYENRDDPVYKDDCVEIFIRPDEQSDHYLGLEMNARGVLLDYFYPFPGKNDHSLNLAGVLLKTDLRGTLNQSADQDQGWSLELAIPWASLNKPGKTLPPTPADQWRVQLNRWDGTAPRRRLSMWCHSGLQRPHPHNPARFGVLRFR